MNSQTPVIALLPWGNVFEDFLDAINISFEQFCQEMTGGWLFGYVEALQYVGIQSILICVSRQVQSPTRYMHWPTGIAIWALPASSLYTRVNQSRESSGSEIAGIKIIRKLQRSWSVVLEDITPYLSTPLKSLTEILKKENCQAILCQEYEYSRFDACTWVGRQLNIPVYATFQGGDFQTSRLEKWARPKSIKACAGLIVAPQNEIHRVTEQYNISEQKIARIFNPLNLNIWANGDGFKARQQLGIASSIQVVVWHGRVDIHRKGLDILLQAWQQVCQQRPQRDLCLLLIGTGEDADALQQQIDDLQLAPHLHWVNEYILDRTKLCDYLHAADFYTLPSRHEGFAVAPLEAMACKLPIVATDAPGVPDILEGGEMSGGIMVPKANSEALAEAIGRLLDDNQLCQTLAQHAYQRVQSAFAIEAVGHQFADFFRL